VVPLERQREGAAAVDPVRPEAGIEMYAVAVPAQPAEPLDVFRAALDEGFRNVGRPPGNAGLCGQIGPRSYTVHSQADMVK
jgi:hypothetical protein